jgi:hypothetical protein
MEIPSLCGDSSRYLVRSERKREREIVYALVLIKLYKITDIEKGERERERE